MKAIMRGATALLIALVLCAAAAAQSSPSAQIAELNSLKEKVKDPDTRTRVSAFHRVWTIALDSDNSDAALAQGPQ